jgi:hypothetical protein
MNGLVDYTSQQLVEELTNRQTWVGLVIHSENEARPPYTSYHRNFALRFNTETLNLAVVRTLLEEVLENLPQFEDASP